MLRSNIRVRRVASTRSNFAEILGIRKLRVLYVATVWHCERDPISFSRFSRTPTCDGQTDADTGP